MSDAILVDSDILIEVLRDRNAIIRDQWRALELEASVVACSPISVAEIWHGARAQETEVIARLFESLTCLGIDAEIGQVAGTFLKRFHPTHRLGIADALIAATAVVHQFRLWTRNRRHYPMREVHFY